jgi:hypothetical protein
MKQKETPLVKAFPRPEEQDVANNFGNVSICKHTLALVQAAISFAD